MSASSSSLLGQLFSDGFAMLKGVFDEDEIRSLRTRISARLNRSRELSTLRSRGITYGSRNLVEALPEAGRLFSNSQLRQFALAVLNQGAGVVRGLYFDKPPGRAWSLPWHKDRTIAVKRNDLPSSNFQKPTFKAGVAHVEAPGWLLERMLTLRIHLDAMTCENGPLCVIPGSHLASDAETSDGIELHAEVGDVLAMRPLLSHSSKIPLQDSDMHRRVIHIELAQKVVLPDGYEWHSFMPLDAPRCGLQGNRDYP